MEAQNVYAIEFAEVENLLLAEPVLRIVARLLAFGAAETEDRVERAKNRIFELAEQDIERICVDFTKRRLERALSTMGFREKTVEALSAEFDASVKTLDAGSIYLARKSEMEETLRTKNYRHLLALYENKGAVKQIGSMFNLKANEYPDFVLRQLGSDGGKELLLALRSLVPDLKGGISLDPTEPEAGVSR